MIRCVKHDELGGLPTPSLRTSIPAKRGSAADSCREQRLIWRHAHVAHSERDAEADRLRYPEPAATSTVLPRGVSGPAERKITRSPDAGGRMGAELYVKGRRRRTARRARNRRATSRASVPSTHRDGQAGVRHSEAGNCSGNTALHVAPCGGLGPATSLCSSMNTPTAPNSNAPMSFLTALNPWRYQS